jgi:hypothetical protein
MPVKRCIGRWLSGCSPSTILKRGEAGYRYPVRVPPGSMRSMDRSIPLEAVKAIITRAYEWTLDTAS